jgi:methyl-branched lipid omega-hydroxylase
MIAMDDPRHARLRRIVSAGFTPRMLKRVEDSVQRVAARIIDDIAERGECDFVTEVAAALPLQIICDMMGIPDSDYAFVLRCTNTILGGSDTEYIAEGVDIPTARNNAARELAELMGTLAADRRGKDGDDLTTILVNATVDGEQLTSGELVSFFNLLTTAGNETTRNAISHGMQLLHDHPDQRAIWAADFDGVAPTAVEEIVRWASPVVYMRRTATSDTVIRGQEIKAGDKLCMFYLSANHDEDHFENARAFDVLRSPNAQLGFGGPGPHFCLGAHLARREVTVMFRELFSRLPDLSVSGPADYLRSSFIHGVKHLPCSFTPTCRT